jgi:hypothetical protein
VTKEVPVNNEGRVPERNPLPASRTGPAASKPFTSTGNPGSRSVPAGPKETKT